MQICGQVEICGTITAAIYYALKFEKQISLIIYLNIRCSKTQPASGSLNLLALKLYDPFLTVWTRQSPLSQIQLHLMVTYLLPQRRFSNNECIQFQLVINSITVFSFSLSTCYSVKSIWTDELLLHLQLGGHDWSKCVTNHIMAKNDSKTNLLFFLKKLGQPRPLFCLFLVFSNKQYNFYNK